MAGKTDRTKLASAILGVGSDRLTGVQKGDAVNAAGTKAPDAGQEESAKDKAEADVTAGTGTGQGKPAQKEASAPKSNGLAQSKTARVAFLCTPNTKKHLKQLALNMDTDVSKLIYDALESKGYLPK